MRRIICLALVLMTISPNIWADIKTKKDVNVVILLNDKPYREYSVSYENESATQTGTHEYVPEATEPTEPETEPAYEPEETEPSYDDETEE